MFSVVIDRILHSLKLFNNTFCITFSLNIHAVLLVRNTSLLKARKLCTTEGKIFKRDRVLLAISWPILGHITDYHGSLILAGNQLNEHNCHRYGWNIRFLRRCIIKLLFPNGQDVLSFEMQSPIFIRNCKQSFEVFLVSLVKQNAPVMRLVSSMTRTNVKRIKWQVRRKDPPKITHDTDHLTSHFREKSIYICISET